MKIIEATTEATQDPSKRYRCRHIFIDGHRCGSPSLRGENLCYYHHTTRGFADEKRHRRTWKEFELPPLEDRSSVLAAITEVLQRIACGNLPSKQAGLLLYGLQIASLNLPEPGEAKSDSKAQTVEEVIINPRHGDLAPIAEFVDSPQPAILPNLNASTDLAAPQTHDLIAPPQKHVISTEGCAFAAVVERPPHFARSTTPLSGNPITAKTEISIPTAVILIEASRSFIARGAIEGPAVAVADSIPPQTHVISTEGEAAVERPLYFAFAPANPPTEVPNPSLPAKPEINISSPVPSSPTWYPNICHAYEKRTSRPPHSAHRHQAAQRRRSRRRHELHGLQLA